MQDKNYRKPSRVRPFFVAASYNDADKGEKLRESRSVPTLVCSDHIRAINSITESQGRDYCHLRTTDDHSYHVPISSDTFVKLLEMHGYDVFSTDDLLQFEAQVKQKRSESKLKP